MQQWVIVGTLALTTCVLWINTLTSGIVKQPVLVIGATLFLVLRIAGHIHDNSIKFSFSIVDFAVFAHVPLFILSAWLTFSPLYTWNALSLGVSCLIFFWAGSSLFTTTDEVNFLFSSLALLATLLCIVGGMQYLFGPYLPLIFFIGPDKRVSSLLGNSNFFASFIVLMFPITLSQSLHQYRLGRRHLQLFALPAVLVLFLFATQTRSSLIGSGVSLVVLALLLWEKKNAKILIGVISVFVAAFLFWILVVDSGLGVRLTTMFDQNRDSSLARRAVFWVGGVHAFLAAPIAGHGIGSFQQIIQQFRSPDYWMVLSEDIVQHAHNEIVEIATEFGIIGLALLAVTLYLVMGRGYVVARHGTGWERIAAAGLTSSLAAIAVDNLGNVTLREAPITAITWLFAGLLSSQLFNKDSVHAFSIANKVPKVLSYALLAAWGGFTFLYVHYQLNIFAADSHIMEGITQGYKNNELAAQIEFQKALTNDPMNLLAHSMLSMSYIRTKDWQSSIRAVDTLQKLSPQFPKSWFVKARAYSGLKEHSKALTSIHQELRLRTHPESYSLEALLHRRIGDTTQERRVLVELLTRSANSRVAYLMQQSCIRLLELSPSEAQRREALELYDALEKQWPGEREFFEALRSVGKTK